MGRVVGHSFEELEVEVEFLALEDEFLVEGDGGEEFFFELQVSGLRKHADIMIVKGSSRVIII